MPKRKSKIEPYIDIINSKIQTEAPAIAIIDRVVHHCEIIKITGNSYRLKGKNIYDDNLEI